MEKCGHCPIAGPCRSYRGLCECIATGSARCRAILDARNARLTDPKPFDVEADRPPPVPLADRPPLLSLAETQHARKYGLNKCWFSYKDSACGCTGLQCHRLKRIVSLRDCVACLKTW